MGMGRTSVVGLCVVAGAALIAPATAFHALPARMPAGGAARCPGRCAQRELPRAAPALAIRRLLRAQGDGGDVASAAAAVEQQIAEDLAFYEAITSVDDEPLRAATLRALDILASALRLYGPQRTVVSFNGGKDADVVLHLMRAASAKYCADNSLRERPPLVYFEDPKEFPEVEAHVASAVERYQCQLVRYSSGIKAGLADLVDQSPRTLAFVLGTRQGDPNCGDQGAFAPSSSYMPNFMRVNPILTWNYGQVWQGLGFRILRFHARESHAHLELCAGVAVYQSAPDPGVQSLSRRVSTSKP
jgi:hypothetical protein